ncbi:SUN family protein NCA3 NDAI_0G06060 [Naumovozyma dairenensis CBS 421]|uniref:SUN4 n=1 Tax=Naumovozyma dairenensis (strain ATCC 10597 / BCRC 20456 / CBS 421 / NBRC 0211 / NRRL Y-12639) TaxID=1071378 RepID=J7REP7_NAUDC|nr:hypothetical protein NDAI_0G06060 [Naumovozyma dairenensis CBS 421]CCK73589.1 hypothetical protein NDAI_0G06060 [Naumovozyma dairenensis CBS 421]
MKFSTLLTSSSVLLTLVSAAPAPAPAPAENSHRRDYHHEDRHNDKRAIQYVTVTEKAGSAKKTTLISPSKSTSVSTEKSTESSSIVGDLESFVAPSKKFKDGEIKCSSFPSGQGVISVPWLNLNGWASIMNMDADISTECKDGYYCSYACQAGMSKTQWPSEQPNDGKAVGGLICKDGYLYRTNTDSDYLCQWDVDSAQAVNKLDKDIALCRTDYPGSENMVIPTLVESNGGKSPVSVVDEDSFFKWSGKKTSSQYYVNNAGVSVEDGCVWGDEDSQVGNWAPIIFGAGYTNDQTYLSLLPNPNTNQKANFNVKIVGTDGSDVQGECIYENGSFSSSDGCTVSVLSGSAQFIFY